MDYRLRNKKIYEEHLKGVTFSELGRKYNICLDRARTIFLRESRNAAREGEMLRQLLFSLADNEDFATRAYNVLHRAGIDNEDKLVRLDRQFLRGLRGCGTKTEELIMQVIDEIRKDGRYEHEV